MQAVLHEKALLTSNWTPWSLFLWIWEEIFNLGNDISVLQEKVVSNFVESSSTLYQLTLATSWHRETGFIALRGFCMIAFLLCILYLFLLMKYCFFKEMLDLRLYMKLHERGVKLAHLHKVVSSERGVKWAEVSWKINKK